MSSAPGDVGMHALLSGIGHGAALGAYPGAAVSEVEAYRWLDEHPEQAIKVALTYGGDPARGEER